MKVLRIQPKKYPEVIEIDGSLESLQKEVAGPIQAVYPTIRLRLSATRKENWPKIPSVTVTECFVMRLGFPMILLLELS